MRADQPVVAAASAIVSPSIDHNVSTVMSMLREVAAGVGLPEPKARQGAGVGAAVGGGGGRGGGVVRRFRGFPGRGLRRRVVVDRGAAIFGGRLLCRVLRRR